MKAIATKIDHFAVNVGALAVSGLFKETLRHGLECFEDRNGDFIIIDTDNDGEILKCSPKFSSALNLDLVEPGFIPVPASSFKWGDKTIHVPAFHIEQYLGSIDSDGNAICTTTEKPKNNISQEEAIEACNKAGRKITRGSQAIAISLNIASVDKNWTGGKVGEGELIRGLHKGTVSGPVANDYESSDPAERRWHELTNGHRIYDWSGHLYEHLFDDIHGDENGVVSGSIPADSPYLTLAPFPSMKKGMGYIYTGPLHWSGSALFRGGYWYSDDRAGAFCLYRWYPDGRYDFIGFRSTK
jgi:hypothetical protein